MNHAASIQNAITMADVFLVLRKNPESGRRLTQKEPKNFRKSGSGKIRVVALRSTRFGGNHTLKKRRQETLPTTPEIGNKTLPVR
jgi:hypothetical protein